MTCPGNGENSNCIGISLIIRIIVPALTSIIGADFEPHGRWNFIASFLIFRTTSWTGQGKYHYPQRTEEETEPELDCDLLVTQLMRESLTPRAHIFRKHVRIPWTVSPLPTLPLCLSAKSIPPGLDLPKSQGEFSHNSGYFHTMNRNSR